MSFNDIAWSKIFSELKISEQIEAHSYFIISAKQIKDISNREARLMTKFDHKSQLPKLFVENNISILPTSRGGYILGNIDSFHHFNNEEVQIKRIAFPNFLESLNYNEITSEATAINCAFVTGMLQDFTGEKELFPTVSGRMSSSSFKFKINSTTGLFDIDVVNSQVEIDGGYEGAFSLNLIEAKNYISDDFLIRQLYYPYKLWVSKVSKKVRPIFLTYTNGIFHLREYAFEDRDHYNSLKLVQERKYTIADNMVSIKDIKQIIDKIKTVDEPSIPFPQADSFERVINLCELLRQKTILTKDDITRNYDFDARQTDYYTNAARYLELINSKNEGRDTIFFLTEKGEDIFTLSINDRQIEFVKVILSHTAFKKTLQLYFEKNRYPTKAEIVKIMKGSNLYNVGTDTTYFRRASTISSWISWILNLIE